MTNDNQSVYTTAARKKIYSNPAWFCETCLFTRLLHSSSLKAETFSNMFTLTGDVFVDCLKSTPTCFSFIYRYAQAYLQLLSTDDEFVGLQYAEYHDPDLPARVLSELDRGDITWSSPQVEEEVVHAFLAVVQDKSLPHQDVIDQLPQVFAELDDEHGVYVKVKQHDERRRSMCSALTSIWLVQNRYDLLAGEQSATNRMSPELWEEFQEFIRWVDLSEETLHALLVFLTIRGLGKARSVAAAVPKAHQSPEDIVLYLMREADGLVPSVRGLTRKMERLVEKTLEVHGCFNLAQMLQGENTPKQVQVLASVVQSEDGEELFKFYLLGLVGVMAGLRGAETFTGSLFLDNNNGRTLLTCINFLRKITTTHARAIYWGYIRERALTLGLPTEREEDFVIARLACLTRATPKDAQALQSVLRDLASSDRAELIEHFLADGIQNQAFTFSFLPSFLINCKKNQNIGLRRAFMLLLELVEALTAQFLQNSLGEQTITVNLQDVATFAEDVVNPRIFEECSSYWKFRMLMGNVCGVHIVISPEHWKLRDQALWTDEQTHGLKKKLIKLDRQMGVALEAIEQIRGEKKEAVWIANI